MKRLLSVLLIAVLGLGIVGCTAEQKKQYIEYTKTLKEYADASKEKTDELIGAADEALKKIAGLITEAEKDEAPEVAGEPSPVVENAGSILKAIAPTLPPLPSLPNRAYQDSSAMASCVVFRIDCD